MIDKYIPENGHFVPFPTLKQKKGNGEENGLWQDLDTKLIC